MLSLSGAGTMIHSPLSGPVLARELFPAPSGGTAESQPTLRAVTRGAAPDGTLLVNIWFHSGWQLPGGAAGPLRRGRCAGT
jgi:hypothetical protein